jgi:hypothetical protein
MARHAPSRGRPACHPWMCDPGSLWIGFIVLALAGEGDAAPSSCLGDAASGLVKAGRDRTAVGLDGIGHAPDSLPVGGTP